MKEVYLDNNATTMVAGEVLDEMLPYFHDFYGNPSSMHSFGGQVARKLTEARQRLQRCLAPTRRRSSSRAAAPKATTRPSHRPWRIIPQRTT